MILDNENQRQNLLTGLELAVQQLERRPWHQTASDVHALAVTREAVIAAPVAAEGRMPELVARAVAEPDAAESDSD